MFQRILICVNDHDRPQPEQTNRNQIYRKHNENGIVFWKCGKLANILRLGNHTLDVASTLISDCKSGDKHLTDMKVAALSLRKFVSVLIKYDSQYAAH